MKNASELNKVNQIDLNEDLWEDTEFVTRSWDEESNDYKYEYTEAFHKENMKYVMMNVKNGVFSVS